MNLSEVLRVFVVFVCFANLGVMIGLFERVGKFFVPKTGMRTLFVGNAIVIGAVGVGNILHLRSPLVSVSYGVAIGVTLQLAALGGLWYWYGTEEGVAHSGRMVDSIKEMNDARSAEETGETTDDQRLDRRLRALTLGMLFLFGNALVSIVVVGYFVIVTHTSLCTFRNDLAGRVETSQLVLAQPGNGGKIVNVFGLKVPRAEIVTQVKSQQSALRSLNGLRCP